MPAPRCPPIHKPAAEWEKWADTYQKYKPVKVPSKLKSFEKFTNIPKFRFVGSVELDRAWKYYLYLHLSGRKHRTLTTELKN